MTCPSCEARASNPHSGLYHADCQDCKARQSEIALPLHMEHLKRTPGSADRRAYIDGVERKEGSEAAHKLKAEFAKWWGMK